MTAKLTSASFELGVRTASNQAAGAHASEGPFTILLLGDYTGRANRGLVEALHGRRPVAVEADNLDQVVARFAARLKLRGIAPAGAETEISFSSLQAFHPDDLLKHVTPLAQWTEARRLLLDPAKAAQGEAALRALFTADTVAPPAAPSTVSSLAGESNEETLARLLGSSPPPVKASTNPNSTLDQLIRQIVAPHISPVAVGGQTGVLAAAHLELTRRLGSLLHHPDFQSLEAVWRGADLLVRRIESSEEIRLLLLDVSLNELQAACLETSTEEPGTLFRLLRDFKPRLWIGNYTFGHTAADLRLLEKIAETASRLAAPFVAAGASQLAGCESFARHPDPEDWNSALPADLATAWADLRRSAHARFIGLAAPRFLLRQPYGASGEAIETFPYEELTAEPPHESFLWGPPAILIAWAAIAAIQSGDPGLSGFTGGELDGLPVHKFTEAGETVVKPYAETWLTDRATDRMLARGLLPVIPVKNQNAVRVNHLQSVASTPTSLAWA